MEVEVKERPILFSGPMVRAILEGRKTQTRRVIKPQPNLSGMWGKKTFGVTEDPFLDDVKEGTWMCYEEFTGFDGTEYDMRPIGVCPYGKPGDRLWVRETFRIVGRLSGGELYHEDKAVRYAATWDKSNSGLAWKPSIHMPRWASRIALEVTNVRVERVQGISEQDAIAEGLFSKVDGEGPFGTQYGWEEGKFTNRTAYAAFARLWDKINLERGYGWETNPWVWVVEFKKIG